MNKIIYVFGLILLGAVLKVNGLQCYVCTNCASVKDEHLQTCFNESSSTTQSPTTTPGSSTTTTSSSSTTTTTSSSQTTTPTTTTTISTTTPTTTTTSTTTPTRTTTTLAAGVGEDLDSVVIESEDNIRAVNDTTPYVCWKDSVTVNGTTVVVRGCGITKTCEANQLSAKCLICDSDKCNSAHSLAVSTFILSLISFQLLILCR